MITDFKKMMFGMTCCIALGLGVCDANQAAALDSGLKDGQGTQILIGILVIAFLFFLLSRFGQFLLWLLLFGGVATIIVVVVYLIPVYPALVLVPVLAGGTVAVSAGRKISRGRMSTPRASVSYSPPPSYSEPASPVIREVPVVIREVRIERRVTHSARATHDSSSSSGRPTPERGGRRPGQ